MSKNILQKTVKKCNVWLIVSAALVLVGLLVAMIFGFSNHISTGSYKTLTVNVNGVFNEAHRTAIETVVDGEIGDLDVKMTYVSEVASSTVSNELVYVFETNTDLENVKAALQDKFDVTTADDTNILYGDIIKVSVNTEGVLNNLPEGFLLRGVIAGAVFVVLAFVYAALRYKLYGGIVMAGSMTVGAALTCVLLIVTRIPLTTTVMYAVEFSLLLTAVCVMLTLSKEKKIEESDAAKDMTAEDKAVEGIAVKENFALIVCTTVATVILAVVGLIGAMNVFTFAVLCLLTVVAVTFASLVFAPSLYFSTKGYADAVAAKKAKYDYKKSSKKTEKTAEKKDEATVEE